MVTKISKTIEANTKAFIVQAIKDIVSDPDFGLELTKRAEGRLKRAQTVNGKTTPLSEIKKAYC